MVRVEALKALLTDIWWNAGKARSGDKLESQQQTEKKKVLIDFDKTW